MQREEELPMEETEEMEKEDTLAIQSVEEMVDSEAAELLPESEGMAEPEEPEEAAEVNALERVPKRPIPETMVKIAVLFISKNL